MDKLVTLFFNYSGGIYEIFYRKHDSSSRIDGSRKRNGRRYAAVGQEEWLYRLPRN
jgi:hypothetical protein